MTDSTWSIPRETIVYDLDEIKEMIELSGFVYLTAVSLVPLPLEKNDGFSINLNYTSKFGIPLYTDSDCVLASCSSIENLLKQVNWHFYHQDNTMKFEVPNFTVLD